MSTRPAAVVVLAAGGGTRMKSATPKVMHEIGGRSLVGHVLAAAHATDPHHLVAVIRHERDRVAEHIQQVCPTAQLADQDEIKGTGRAVECGLDALPADLSGTVLVTAGDVPLLQPQTLSSLVEGHEAAGAVATVLTAHVPNPAGYGRIVRDQDGGVKAIVEHKDATEDQRAITEINSGIFAFDLATVRSILAEVGTDNAQGEKYLTDVIGIAVERGLHVAAHSIEDVMQTEGANDRAQLAGLGRELNRRVCEQWMRDGVTIVDPATTWIDVDVTLAADVHIEPGVQLRRGTTVATGAVIGPDSTLSNVTVGEDAQVVRVHGSDSRIDARASVGPFSYLRPGTHLGEDGKIGTFVETKKAEIGKGSKIPHLSYIGDALIGEQSNIGAASVFVNYDGVNKHQTTVGNHCRLGSDNMYVAPVTIGDGAYSGAGTVIRQDVPPGALAINVAPQRNIEGWVQRKRPGTAAADAADAATASSGQKA